MGYKTLDQRLRDLWKFENGFEMLDLDLGFYLLRFYSKKDYLHVLEGGPWVILGHYLTVSKWKPEFRPSTASISSTLV